MLRNQKGFTLVELIITMVIFVLAMAASSNMFISLVNQFKQQSKVAQTNIEGIVGLELLRYDIEQAGFGIPWDLNGTTGYPELAAGNIGTGSNDATLGWPAAPAPSGPRPIATAQGVTMSVNGTLVSDLLVIRATNVATNDASNKWTYMSDVNGADSIPAQTGNRNEDLQTGDEVIVVTPTGTGTQRILVTNGNQLYATFNPSAADSAWSGFRPAANTNNLIYGIKTAGNPIPTMPFNRADYYVRTPAANMPQRCAPGTGILYKATVNHSTDHGYTEYPLLDCVVAMKTVSRLDTNADGLADLSSEGLIIDAAAIRAQLKEVRIYILAQEGQMDANYTFMNPTNVDPTNANYKISDPDTGDLVTINLQNVAGSRFRNYRWKLYTLVVTPYNLL